MENGLTIDEIKRIAEFNKQVSKLNEPVVGSAKLSKCCGTNVGIRNTLNDIPCYYCHKCNKLTGVVDENGNRVN